MLNAAIVEIGSFGVDYEAMTEQQQYTLGSYVNLMSASAQLLVNPILGLQPNYTEKNLDAYFSSNKVEIDYRLEKKMIVYFDNLVFKI